jgi:hypothetical protein
MKEGGQYDPLAGVSPRYPPLSSVIRRQRPLFRARSDRRRSGGTPLPLSFRPLPSSFFLHPLAAPERLGEGGSSFSPRPLIRGKMSKNGRVSAAQAPHYHVLMGPQHKK